MLIHSAGPASVVCSLRDELLLGSSFFLPSPSPLWPSGHDGKTSLVNYLRAARPIGSAGEWANVCVCVLAARPYGSAGMLWALGCTWTVCESRRNTIWPLFLLSSVLQSCTNKSVSEHCVPGDFVKHEEPKLLNKIVFFSARLWNCLHELLCVAQSPETHFTLASNIVYSQTCQPPTSLLTSKTEVRLSAK